MNIKSINDLKEIKTIKKENSFKILTLNNVKSVMQNKNIRMNSSHGFRKLSEKFGERKIDDESRKPQTSYGFREQKNKSPYQVFPTFGDEEKPIYPQYPENHFSSQVKAFRNSGYIRPQTSLDNSNKKRVSLKDLLQFRVSNETKGNN